MTSSSPDAERRAWITLASVQGIGEETFGLLVATFGGARHVLDAMLDGRLDAWLLERRSIEGRPPVNAPTVGRLRTAAADPDSLLADVATQGLWTLTPHDPGYPARLRDLPAPPAMINGAGDPLTMSMGRAIGVVGTRHPTPAGRQLAARICARLVECGATVVSGLAVGIDGSAQAATVERGGTTVGVIGAGHMHPGPRAHTRLRTEVVASGGAVISEHHPRTTATRGTYPRRNRIIAALSDAVLVIEAPRKSGAINTARHALDLGRPVFVAPGRVGDWSTAGSLTLLRETPARPLIGLDELIEDLGYFEPEPGAAASAQVGARGPALAMLGPAERVVAARLCSGPAGLDLLVADTGLAPGVVSGAVTLLLIRGWVQSHGPAFVAAGPLAT